MSVSPISWTAAGALVALLVLSHAPAAAQVDANLSSYTGKNAEGYLKPLQEGFGAALNDAWFRTAAIPKAGFQLNVELKSMFTKFGDEDRTFTAETEDGFFQGGQQNVSVEAPTVIGDTTAARVEGDNGTVAYMPGGLDVGSLGVAVPQVTIGGFMGTQAVLRYIAVDTGDAEVGDLSLFGFGVRHSISQYFMAPPVDIAASFFYQNFELGGNLVDATGISFGVQGSKNFGVLEPYLGLGYDTFSMSVEYESEAADEKLDVEFDDVSNLHITGGLGINLLSFLHLHGEINSSSQTSYALGLSLGN
jgi:hypothetical protein